MFLSGWSLHVRGKGSGSLWTQGPWNIQKSFMAKVNPSGVIMVKLTPIHYELWWGSVWCETISASEVSPAIFFSQDHSRRTALSRVHTRLASLAMFFCHLFSPDRPRHTMHDLVLDHTRSSLLYARLTLLTGVHRACLVFPYKHVVMCRILELFSINTQLISKFAFLYLALTSFNNLMQT